MRMGKRFIWLLLSSLIVVSLVLASCTTATEEEEEEGVVEEEEEEEEEEEGPPVSGEWWEAKWGQPEYGGTITYRTEMIDDVFFDPTVPMGAQWQAWQDNLFAPDPTVDREIFPFKTQFVPAQYMTGVLAESWEQTDPQTITVKLKQGVHWQNKPPVYGREFTAEDVAFTYDVILGIGEFTVPNPFYSPQVPSIERAVAVDKYTVDFKLKTPSAMGVYQVLGAIWPQFGPSAREWIGMDEAGQKDWQNAIGTGPFILTELVRGTSITLSRNPDYHGYDKRYPENQLPYAETLKILSVVDMSTALAALRTGKLDLIIDGRSHPSYAQAQSLAKTNPEIEQSYWPSAASGVTLRYGAEHFTDIKVRQALQLAIDIETIAKTYYQGSVEGKPAGLLSPLIGEDWSVPYDDWPAELQAEYSYNPERARELLAEAGYPDGFKTNVVAATVDDLQLLQIIQSMFLDIGVDMEIRAMDKITAHRFILDKKHDQMNFGGGGGGIGTPTLATYKSDYHENRACVDDPHYDQLAEQFVAAPTIEEAQRVFREADRYVLEQHWAVKVCPILGPQAFQPWIKGYMGEMWYGTWNYQYIARMWIDQELKKSLGY